MGWEEGDRVRERGDARGVERWHVAFYARGGRAPAPLSPARAPPPTVVVEEEPQSGESA